MDCAVSSGLEAFDQSPSVSPHPPSRQVVYDAISLASDVFIITTPGPEPVRILNPSFEAQNLTAQGVLFLNNVRHWGTQGSAGVFNVASAPNASAIVDGANVGFVRDGGVLRQTLRNVDVEAGAVYTLSAFVASRADRPFVDDVTVALVAVNAAGVETELAGITITRAQIEAGDVDPITLSYEVPEGVATIGQDLRIRVSARSPTDPAGQALVDAFSFTAQFADVGLFSTAMLTTQEDVDANEPAQCLQRCRQAAFSVTGVIDANQDGISGIAQADFDGDGDMDYVVVAQTSNTVTVIENINQTSFLGRPVTNALASPRFIAAGDLNRDGHPDFVTASVTGSVVRYFLNNGGSTDFANRGVTVATGSLTGPRGMVMADVDGDRDLDLVIASSDDNTITILYANCCVPGRSCGGGCSNNANLTFATPITLPLATGARAVAVADVNGDGRMDIVAAGSSLVVFYATQVTELGFVRSVVGLGARVPSFTAVRVADINADGLLDIVTASIGDSRMTIHQQTTAGAFVSIIPIQSLVGVSGLAVADLEADGWLDIVVTSRSDNRVAVFRGSATGVGSQQVRGGSGWSDGGGRLELMPCFRSWPPPPLLLLTAAATWCSPTSTAMATWT